MIWLRFGNSIAAVLTCRSAHMARREQTSPSVRTLPSPNENRWNSTGPAAKRADEAWMVGLYPHIPFCSAICSYCNFNRGLFDAALKDRYVAALDHEIRAARQHERAADTIFFGGGTPSLL